MACRWFIAEVRIGPIEALTLPVRRDFVSRGRVVSVNISRLSVGLVRNRPYITSDELFRWPALCLAQWSGYVGQLFQSSAKIYSRPGWMQIVQITAIDRRPVINGRHWVSGARSVTSEPRDALLISWSTFTLLSLPLAADVDFGLDSCILPSVTHCGDLGVTITSDLSFTQYITKIVSKAHES